MRGAIAAVRRFKKAIIAHALPSIDAPRDRERSYEPHARVDFCPLVRDGAPGADPTLIKCCLRERGIEQEGARVTVPWGATLEEVREALRLLVGAWQPVPAG